LIGHVVVRAGSGFAEAERSSAAIQSACEHAGWNLVEIVRDRHNGRIGDAPGVALRARAHRRRRREGLVVSDLRRLTRSIVDLGAVITWFRDADATLIALDLGIDTSTPEGVQVAATLIALSRHEHQLIASRTRRGLAEVRGNRAKGRAGGPPPPRVDGPDRRDARRGHDGCRPSPISSTPKTVPTLRWRARWRPSSIQACLGYRRPEPRDHLPELKTRSRVTPILCDCRKCIRQLAHSRTLFVQRLARSCP